MYVYFYEILMFIVINYSPIAFSDVGIIDFKKLCEKRCQYMRNTEIPVIQTCEYCNNKFCKQY